MSLKEQFIAELNPLLAKTEKAIVAHDEAEANRLSIETLKLVMQYDGRLSRDQIRAALNNPVAAAIAKRLGVQPP